MMKKNEHFKSPVKIFNLNSANKALILITEKGKKSRQTYHQKANTHCNMLKLTRFPFDLAPSTLVGKANEEESDIPEEIRKSVLQHERKLARELKEYRMEIEKRFNNSVVNQAYNFPRKGEQEEPSFSRASLNFASLSYSIYQRTKKNYRNQSYEENSTTGSICRRKQPNLCDRPFQIRNDPLSLCKINTRNPKMDFDRTQIVKLRSVSPKQKLNLTRGETKRYGENSCKNNKSRKTEGSYLETTFPSEKNHIIKKFHAISSTEEFKSRCIKAAHLRTQTIELSKVMKSLRQNKITQSKKMRELSGDPSGSSELHNADYFKSIINQKRSNQRRHPFSQKIRSRHHSNLRNFLFHNSFVRPEISNLKMPDIAKRINDNSFLLNNV